MSYLHTFELYGMHETNSLEWVIVLPVQLRCFRMVDIMLNAHEIRHLYRFAQLQHLTLHSVEVPWPDDIARAVHVHDSTHFPMLRTSNVSRIEEVD